MVSKLTKAPTGNEITNKINELTDVNKNTSRSTEFIMGTQTETTASWTGVTEDSSLYDGKNINYYLNQTSAANATINLTLSGGTTTGAKNIYLNGTARVGIHFPKNAIVNLTYYSTNDAWYVNSYRDTNDNTFDRVKNSNNVHARGACTAGKLLCANENGYKDVASGVTFGIDYPLLYCKTAITNGNNGTDTYLSFPGVNLQTTKASWTGTQWSSVYLVGTLSGKTITIDSSIFTTTIPTSADGKVYMPLGVLYSTKEVYFVSSKDLYAYRNGSFQRLQPDLSTYQKTNNLVTSISSSSTNTQYPSAKCVYDAIQNSGGGSSYAPTVTTSGSSWCRVYPADSTGYRWCEQGGVFTSKSTAAYETVNLLQSYKDTDYVALCAIATTATAGYSQAAAAIYYSITSKAVGSFQMYGSPTQALRDKSWFTAGYLPNS